jgi:ribosomal-protein-alanine N-acetyltransferase
MVLREFKSADLETLHSIDAACFPAEIAYSIEELEAFIHHPHSKTWVAVESDQTAGFLVAQRLPAQVAHIITIDVIKEARRGGVGSMLVRAAERWARAEGCRLMSLETAEDNRAAQAFYNELGYKQCKQIKNYYGDGTAAWVMSKPL